MPLARLTEEKFARCTSRTSNHAWFTWAVLVALALTAPTAFAQGSLRDLGTTVGEPVSIYLTNIGAATTQGDAVMNANTARSTFGVDGAGIKIGVISDSYDKNSGAAGNITAGDLPGVGNPNGYTTPITVVKDDLSSSMSDEGRAMLQIVHDVAPGAELLFHSAFNNSTGSGSNDYSTIANAIDALVAAGADIIVDDVGLLNQPFFMNGPTAQAVNNAKAAGVAYFTSAGNSGTMGYVGNFNGTEVSPGVIHHNFDANNTEGGDTLLNFTLANNRSMRISVEWDDPYPSLTAAGNASDFDIGIYDTSTSSYVSTSLRDQGAGDDPWEIVGVSNASGATKTYGLVIQHYSGDMDVLLKAIFFGSGVSFADDDATNSPTIFGHAAAEGAVAVAAHYWGNTTSVESFSSRGPATILFDEDGNRLAEPEVRDKPLLTAPDGVSTTVPGFTTFYGTSAAAPHAAAVAALLLERASALGITLSVDDLYQILYDSAIDMSPSGYDYASGHGRIDAYAALSTLIPEPGSVALLLVGVLTVRRRRAA